MYLIHGIFQLNRVTSTTWESVNIVSLHMIRKEVYGSNLVSSILKEAIY